MKMQEFINQEFIQVADNELKQLFDKQQSKSLIGKIETIGLGEDFDNIELLAELFKNEKQLTKLKLTCFILDQLTKIDKFEFSLSDLKIIEKRIEAKPENKLLHLLWVYQQLNIFKEEEFFETEVIDFFKLLFNDYVYLVELEDFFVETRISTEILYQERLRNSNELLHPVFVEAVYKYPVNLYIKKTLGYICYFKGAYSESLNILNSLIDNIQKYDISIDEMDYLEMIEYSALNYDKLGDDRKVSECVEYVLSNLPVGIFLDGKEEEIASYAKDSFFLRMRLNMKRDNKQKVLDDYCRVKEDLHWGGWGNDYADVMKYAEENITV